MPMLRTKCLSTKLTPDELATVARTAQGQPLSVWARAALLDAVAAPRADHVLLAEVLALRTIVLQIQVAVNKGEALTTEDLQRLMERADQEKGRRAQERLAGASAGRVR